MKQKVTIFICIFLLATGCGQDQTSTQISDITNNETRTLLQIYEEESLVDFVDYLSQCGISYSQFVLGEVDVNTVCAPLKITREGKTVVTLGGYGPLGISCEDATQAFNRISGEYYVEVISYDSAQDLNLALAANKGPDLLNVSGFPVRSYAKQGLFMDLSGLIRDKNEYFDNILELMNYDGQLISVITSYTLDAMAVDASYVQDCEALTWDDYAQLMDETGFYIHRYWEYVLPSFLTTSLEAFVDYEMPCAQFDSDSFYTYIETLLNLSRNENIEPTDLITDTSIAGTNVFVANRENPATPAYSYVGFPNIQGYGISANYLSGLNLAIFSDSACVDGAQEFIAFLLSPAWQENLNCTLPILRRALKTTDQLTSILSGTQELTSAEDLDRLIHLIESANTSSSYDADLYTIAAEELPALFLGEKTLSETVKVIQSRASIYLSEQYGG